MNTIQVYFRPDLEDMLKPVGHRLSVRVSMLMCAAVDGLMYELTEGRELSPRQSWEHAVLVRVYQCLLASGVLVLNESTKSESK